MTPHARLEELLAGASITPWECRDVGYDLDIHSGYDGECIVTGGGHLVTMGDYERAVDDRALIVAVVNALPSLIAENKRLIEEWDGLDQILKEAGLEASKLILMSDMPGGTKTQRVKNRAFADGVAHAVSSIRALLRQRIPSP